MAFESFARGRNCDPLIAETWYSIPREHFVQQKVVQLLFFCYCLYAIFMLTYRICTKLFASTKGM